MAMAAEIGTTYTFDNAIYDSAIGETFSAVDEVMTGSSEYITFDTLHHSPSITLTLGNMLVSDAVDLAAGQKLVLTSVQVVSRPSGSQYRPADSVATIEIGGETFTSAAAVYPAPGSRDLITFTFNTPVDITNATTLTLSISGDFGYSCYAVKNDHQETVTLPSDTATYNQWHMPTRLNTMVAPEPATATLSLLALAGLAARRRH